MPPTIYHSGGREGRPDVGDGGRKGARRRNPSMVFVVRQMNTEKRSIVIEGLRSVD
jgi:hypothetical protein